MKPYEIYYQGEQYFQLGVSLKDAKATFAKYHVCSVSEIESAFQHKYPVKVIIFGIGITALGLAFLVAYLIS